MIDPRGMGVYYERGNPMPHTCMYTCIYYQSFTITISAQGYLALPPLTRYTPTPKGRHHPRVSCIYYQSFTIIMSLQGHLAHAKQTPSIGTPLDPGYSPIVGPWEGAVSDERSTPVRCATSVATRPALCARVVPPSRDFPGNTSRGELERQLPPWQQWHSGGGERSLPDGVAACC